MKNSLNPMVTHPLPGDELDYRQSKGIHRDTRLYNPALGFGYPLGWCE
ncbi:hypothetical protein [Alteromonas aestuariivivens]|nr:hypothetical protein [Alteromonas aestuariivivens]